MNKNSLLLDNNNKKKQVFLFVLIVVDYFVSQRRATPRKHLEKLNNKNSSAIKT